MENSNLAYRAEIKNCETSMVGSFITNLSKNQNFVRKEYVPITDKSHLERFGYTFKNEKVSIVYDTKARILTATTRGYIMSTILDVLRNSQINNFNCYEANKQKPKAQNSVNDIKNSHQDKNLKTITNNNIITEKISTNDIKEDSINNNDTNVDKQNKNINVDDDKTKTFNNIDNTSMNHANNKSLVVKQNNDIVLKPQDKKQIAVRQNTDVSVKINVFNKSDISEQSNNVNQQTVQNEKANNHNAFNKDNVKSELSNASVLKSSNIDADKEFQDKNIHNNANLNNKMHQKNKNLKANNELNKQKNNINPNINKNQNNHIKSDIKKSDLNDDKISNNFNPQNKSLDKNINSKLDNKSRQKNKNQNITQSKPADINNGKLNKSNEKTPNTLEYKNGYSVKNCSKQDFDSMIKEIKKEKGVRVIAVNNTNVLNNIDCLDYDILDNKRQKVHIRYLPSKKSLTLQGKPSELFSSIQLIVSKDSDYKTAINSHIKFAGEESTASKEEKKLKKLIPHAFEFLSEQAKFDFTIGLIDINNPDIRLSDYSVLLVPPYRGLERLIFDIQTAENINVKMIGQAFEKTDTGQYCLKQGYQKKIQSIVFNESISALYTEYFNERNFLTHSDNSLLAVSSRALIDRIHATTKFEKLLNVIDYNCKKLKEIGFALDTGTKNNLQ